MHDCIAFVPGLADCLLNGVLLEDIKKPIIRESLKKDNSDARIFEQVACLFAIGVIAVPASKGDFFEAAQLIVVLQQGYNL